MADISGKITAVNTVATPLAASIGDWTKAKITIRNEGAAADVYLFCPADGTTPTAATVCNSGSVIRLGETRELFDPEQGEDLGQWWVACKPNTGPAVITYTA